MNDNKWVVYLVRCSDKSLYCGISNNLEHRLMEHNSGKGAKYTKGKKLKLVYYETLLSNSDARRREIEIKKLPLEKKINIITGVKDEN